MTGVWTVGLTWLLCCVHVTASGSNLKLIPDIAHVKHGDLDLGIFSRVHQYDPQSMCSNNPFAFATYEFGPAAIYAIEEINSRQDLLPNVTLGYAIVDDCGHSIPGAARSLQFVPALTVDSYPMSFGNYYEVVGTVGPISSQASLFTASLSSAFRIPTIAASSTADELSDRDRYPYFFRLVAADYYQAEAMVLLLREMGWSYFSVVYMEESYGYSGVRNLNHWSDYYGLCIAKTLAFSSTTNPILIAQELRRAKAKVVAAVLYGEELFKLAAALENGGFVGEFIFVFTDCFVSHVLPAFGLSFVGSLWIHPYDAPDDALEEYLGGLTPQDSPDDPWIEEIVECFETVSPSLSCLVHLPRQVYSVNTDTLRVVDAVYVYAAAIDLLIDDLCPDARGNKSSLKQCVTGPRLAEYLYRIEVERPSGSIKFTEEGQAFRLYEWVQFQRVPNLPFLSAVDFGTFDPVSKMLQVDEYKLVWEGVMAGDETGRPESVCSYPCAEGEIYLEGKLACCWECYRCRDNEIAAYNWSRCVECPPLTWPDEQTGFTSCRQIAPHYLTWNHPYGITLTTLAVVGTVVTCWLLYQMWRHRERRIVRGSGRDMVPVILGGCLLGFISVISFIAKPTTVSCWLSRVGFNVSLAVVFAPLFVKTIRIYRVFRASEHLSQSLSCLSAAYMQLFTWIFISLQAVTLGMTCVIWPPIADVIMPVTTVEYVELRCVQSASTLMFPLGYNLLLLTGCGVGGYLTRKVPENFNESWYIFVTVSVTYVIWVAFLPSYFLAFYVFYQAVLQAFALFLNLTVVIVIVFGPKLYALHNIPDKEIRVTHFPLENLATRS